MPEQLAARLADACPEVWNTYGPTEATVVSSAARLTGDGPVRIGLPLDGWQLAVVDTDGCPVRWGGVGELLIAGVGRARYLDLGKDDEKFVPLPALGWTRVYRSGDLVSAEQEGPSTSAGSTPRSRSGGILHQPYGDSSYIVGFLRALGYRIDRGGQTGSNFGAALSHETPYLIHIGAGTMVADGVDFLTAEFSHTSFVPTSVRLGANSYLGNTIVVPGGGRLGENCLVGTKTMIPIDGPVRSDVGLLGSPAFDIPRTTLRSDYAGLQPVEFHGRLRAKNAHNLRTMMIFKVARWLRVYLAMLVAMLAMAFYRQLGLLTPAIFAVLAATVDLAVSVLVERAATAFRSLQPRYCSIYDRYFWWHERFWKLSSQPTLLNGTPLKPLVWRLLGVHVGRRVFDDGASISEKTLVSIGDGATINAGSTLQAHSMEDGVFSPIGSPSGSGSPSAVRVRALRGHHR